MALILEHVVPWGRSFDEYVRMFDLSPADLESRILDCGAGPASFAAELHARGGRVVACDPIYSFSADDIRRRVTETYDTIVKANEEHRDKFVWRENESPEQLGRRRMQAMERFLEDFPGGLPDGRYRVAELPSLPFRAAEFDLALCSHFLFTYSDLLSLGFHFESIRQLCRVANEARIFPLLPSFGAGHSPHLAPLMKMLSAEGYLCEIKRVPYEFQIGGNETLRVVKPTVRM
jgi:SAM-dependent methyltransferase